MSFSVEQIELDSGFEPDRLQVIDLVDDLTRFSHWREVSHCVQGLIPENLLYMCYEDSPEKVAILLDRLRIDMRDKLHEVLSDRLEGFSLSDRRFNEIVQHRHVARLCMVEEEAVRIRFVEAIVNKIRSYATSVVDDDVVGGLLGERFAD